MKKNVFKMVALVVAISMLFTLMVGCGKKKQTSDIGSPVTLNGDAIYPLQCEDTLTFWFTADTLWQQQYATFGETPLGKEMEKQTGVKIEYLMPSGGTDEQFQIMLSSDDLPDIVNYQWQTFSGGPDLAIQQEYIYELSDIIDKYMPAYKKVLAEHPEWDKMVKSDGGNYYSLPAFSQEGILQVTYGPVIRTDWLRELGLERPETIEEWDAVLEAFKTKKGVEIPFIGSASNLATAFGGAYNLRTGWYHDGGVVKYGQAQPQYKDFLAKMNEWYKKGYINPDFMVIDSSRDTAKILNGQAGASMSWAGSGLGTWLQTNKGKSYELGGTKYPATQKGATPEYSHMSSSVSALSTAISKNCENVELAARFLDFGYTEAGQNMYNFGIEGVTYNWVDKDGAKYPKYTDLITNNPDGLTIGNTISLYCRSGHTNVPMIQSEYYLQQYYSMPEQQEAQKMWEISNQRDHLMPTLYLLDSEMDRDSSIMSAVQTYVDEMTIKFITGEEPLSNFDAYIAQLKNFGIDESTSYRQSAYNRAANR